MTTVVLGILEQQQSLRGVGPRNRGWNWGYVGCGDVLVVDDKVCESLKGTAPGSLREQGRVCTSQSIWVLRRTS